jgi:hypothetical protein
MEILSVRFMLPLALFLSACGPITDADDADALGEVDLSAIDPQQIAEDDLSTSEQGLEAVERLVVNQGGKCLTDPKGNLPALTGAAEMGGACTNRYWVKTVNGKTAICRGKGAYQLDGRTVMLRACVVPLEYLTKKQLGVSGQRVVRLALGDQFAWKMRPDNKLQSIKSNLVLTLESNGTITLRPDKANSPAQRWTFK